MSTLSCQDDDWGRRYFGDNYEKLVAIKKLLDPKIYSSIIVRVLEVKVAIAV